MSELECKINEAIIENELNDLVLFEKLDFFILTTKMLNDFSNNFINYNLYEYEFTKMNLNSQVELVKEFYEYYNINIDIDSLIANGCINFKFTDEIELKGNNSYVGKDEFKVINCTYSGHLVDSIILVHELSHYRNQTDNGRTITNEFFTEGLSIYDELLYMEFLKTKGYLIDSNLSFDMMMYTCNYISENNLAILKILNLYRKFSNVDKENYNLLYNDCNYEESIELMRSDIDYIDLYQQLYYCFGWFIGFYLHSKFDKKLDYTYINSLHEKISEMSFGEFLKEIEFVSTYDCMNKIEGFFDCKYKKKLKK